MQSNDKRISLLFPQKIEDGLYFAPFYDGAHGKRDASKLRAGLIAARSARWDSGKPFKATAVLENIERLDRNRLGFYRMSQLNGSLLHVSGSARPD
jgi:hypothetical protein